MAPPPSQAGKFKPRKAVKKVRVGDITPTGVPSSSAAAPTERSAGRGGRSGRGGRGGGRGGAGRGPQPQGQVFFTATPADVKKGAVKSQSLAAKAQAAATSTNFKSSKNSAASQKAAADAARAKREADSHEEVVGTLEEGIGSSNQDADANGRSKKGDSKSEGTSTHDDYYDTPMGKANGKISSSSRKPSAAAANYTYETDSSMEDDDDSSKAEADPKMQPVVLPFPGSSASVGIGETQRPVFYPLEANNTAPNQPLSKAPATMEESIIKDPVGTSPFVSSGDARAIAAEDDSWFLVQLPTRLPPVQPSKNALPMDESQGLEVRNAPVQVGRFDNSLASARSGRLGKMGKFCVLDDPPNGYPVSSVTYLHFVCHLYCSGIQEWKNSSHPRWDSIGTYLRVRLPLSSVVIRQP